MGFLAGIFIGAILGIVIMSLTFASKSFGAEDGSEGENDE